MARAIRIEYAGATFHPPSHKACVFAKATTAQDGGTGVMARGNQGRGQSFPGNDITASTSISA